MDFPLKMVIFHNFFVRLPEGKSMANHDGIFFMTA